MYKQTDSYDLNLSVFSANIHPQGYPQVIHRAGAPGDNLRRRLMPIGVQSKSENQKLKCEIVATETKSYDDFTKR